jgi:hypothetical protein
MNFKMNWGKGLIGVFCLFALGMGTLAYKASSTKLDLVSNEYYKDELRYQDKIDGMNNASKISDIAITQDATTVTLQLPAELKGSKIEGEIFFYCPKEEANDVKFPIHADTSGRQIIAKKDLKYTQYQVKVTYKTEKSSYYSQNEFIVKK